MMSRVEIYVLFVLGLLVVAGVAQEDDVPTAEGGSGDDVAAVTYPDYGTIKQDEIWESGPDCETGCPTEQIKIAEVTEVKDAIPVQTDAMIVQTDAITDSIPVQTDSIPVQTDSIPVQTDAIPVQTDAIPVQTDAILVQTDAITQLDITTESPNEITTESKTTIELTSVSKVQEASSMETTITSATEQIQNNDSDTDVITNTTTFNNITEVISSADVESTPETTSEPTVESTTPESTPECWHCPIPAECPENDTRKEYTVTSILVPPYLMADDVVQALLQWKWNISELSPGGCCEVNSNGYVGYIVDLLCAIASTMDVRFHITLVADNSYGKQVNDSDPRQWNGMVGEVMSRVADVAAAPLTHTLERDNFVDFTDPFHSTRTVAIFQKRSPDHPQFISSFQDLIYYDFNFGVANNSVIANKLSQSTQHTELWKKVSDGSGNNANGIVDSSQIGLYLARTRSNYAFLADRASVEWVVNLEPCDLGMVDVDPALHSASYALAVPNLHQLRDDLNIQLHSLVSSHCMEDLERKWLHPDICSSSVLLSNNVLIVYTAFIVTTLIRN